MTTLRYGDKAVRLVSARMAAPVANLATLAGYGKSEMSDGQITMDIATGKLWRFSAACALTADNFLVAGSGTGNGRHLLMPGKHVISIPITFATADAAVLWTVPTGALFNLRSLFWKITTDWTGGSSSAIGISSTKTGFTTKGDLLGGAGGDVLAALTVALSPTPGTIGPKIDALTNAELNSLWVATNTIRFDRVTSAFTAGAGSACLVIDLLENPGA